MTFNLRTLILLSTFLIIIHNTQIEATNKLSNIKEEEYEIESTFGIAGFISFLVFGVALVVGYFVKMNKLKYDFLLSDNLEMGYSLIEDKDK